MHFEQNQKIENFDLKLDGSNFKFELVKHIYTFLGENSFMLKLSEPSKFKLIAEIC